MAAGWCRSSHLLVPVVVQLVVVPVQRGLQTADLLSLKDFRQPVLMRVGSMLTLTLLDE